MVDLDQHAIGGEDGGVDRPTGVLIRRVFRALESLADVAKSASDVARLLEVNRSTALRLLTELEATGYVARDPGTKHFRTVPARFYALIANHEDHADWSDIVNPVLAGLRDEFGEAGVMGVPASGTMVYVAFFTSNHVVAVRERLGTTRQMHCSALGKAYLSALDPEALDAELGRLNFVGGTDRAAKGPIELRERVQGARQDGYAIDLNETFEGVSCVAAPVWIADALVGAMGLSGPSIRFTESRVRQIGSRLVEVTERLKGPLA